MKKKPTLLLINPFIYDFAAYDFWLKPLGLLYLAAILEENGCEIVWLDCMDRWHPEVLKLQDLKEPKSRKYGIGPFYKKEALKPEVCKHVKRKFSSYGMPPEVLQHYLKKISSEYKH